MKQIEGIADEVENAVMTTLDKEIQSKQIGKLVMDRLKDIDEVAYVRFASVYRQFKDINTFMEELAKLQAEKDKWQQPAWHGALILQNMMAESKVLSLGSFFSLGKSEGQKEINCTNSPVVI